MPRKTRHQEKLEKIVLSDFIKLKVFGTKISFPFSNKSKSWIPLKKDTTQAKLAY